MDAAQHKVIKPKIGNAEREYGRKLVTEAIRFYYPLSFNAQVPRILKAISEGLPSPVIFK